MTTVETIIDPRLIDTLLELGIEADEITPDSELRADLDIDSAELVEIVSSILGDAPDGKALKEVRTVAQLSEFLCR
jgi:acyl carrier protein